MPPRPSSSPISYRPPSCAGTAVLTSSPFPLPCPLPLPGLSLGSFSAGGGVAAATASSVTRLPASTVPVGLTPFTVPTAPPPAVRWTSTCSPSPSSSVSTSGTGPAEIVAGHHVHAGRRCRLARGRAAAPAARRPDLVGGGAGARHEEQQDRHAGQRERCRQPAREAGRVREVEAGVGVHLARAWRGHDDGRPARGRCRRRRWPCRGRPAGRRPASSASTPSGRAPGAAVAAAARIASASRPTSPAAAGR